MDKKIILASASPRRAELLRQIGLAFEVQVSTAEEDVLLPEHYPEMYVRTLADLKAEDVAARISNGVVIGADTIVILGEQILNKPRDDDDALQMLMLLQGKTHHVVTAVTVLLVENGIVTRRNTEHVSTDVMMRRAEESELSAYIATGEPRDKAGAYAIQGRGSVFIKRIKGDYFNVVGLPLYTLCQMLERVGVSVL